MSFAQKRFPVVRRSRSGVVVLFRTLCVGTNPICIPARNILAKKDITRGHFPSIGIASRIFIYRSHRRTTQKKKNSKQAANLLSSSSLVAHSANLFFLVPLSSLRHACTSSCRQRRSTYSTTLQRTIFQRTKKRKKDKKK